MFNKLFPLCYKYKRKLVYVVAVCQVGLLGYSSFDALHARMSLSLLCMELMPFVRIVLNECLEDGVGLSLIWVPNFVSLYM